ncbi:MAG: hypothetical protein DMG22_18960 [Acidobacteria bacterium]|nr:MAG: hypothetical protein DMG22_18960 [Acidobacteriota bacterium]
MPGDIRMEFCRPKVGAENVAAMAPRLPFNGLGRGKKGLGFRMKLIYVWLRNRGGSGKWREMMAERQVSMLRPMGNDTARPSILKGEESSAYLLLSYLNQRT